MLEHPVHGRRVQSPEVVVDAERELSVREDEQAQGIVRAFQQGYVADAKAPSTIAKDRVYRVILEHQDALEQRLPRWDVAPRLDAGERTELVTAEFNLP